MAMFRTNRSLLILAAATVLASCGTRSDSPASNCDIGPAVETDGYRRLALIVGVGDYEDESIPDLSGTIGDAKKMYELLTETYAFPRENVCLLLDDQATKQSFEDSFNKALVDRAEEGDVAVVFFAGHGSQLPDTNGDEPDEFDETFAFRDANGWGDGELVDDEFHEMLGRLNKKTRHIVAIIDSCNSGTSTRGSSELTARFLPRSGQATGRAVSPDGVGDGGEDWAAESMPGLVALTAASDGTPALETPLNGIFTDALITVLSQPRSGPFTYAQLARQVPLLVSANSYQIPFFQGDLDRPVFGNVAGTRPRGWDVINVDPLEIGGAPMNGAGVGAEFRIFDGAATAADLVDLNNAKATVVVRKTNGVRAEVVVSAAAEGAPPIVPGDLAMLTRVGDDSVRIRVAIRDESKSGGVPAERADRLRAAITADRDASAAVELVSADDQYEISVDERDNLILRGPENRVRVVYRGGDDKVPRNLWQHARQRALLSLKGDVGTDFVDNESLQVQLVPAPTQPDCAKAELWEQAAPNEEQLIPLCTDWQIKVSLAATARYPVLVGGVAMSSNGETFGFPADGRTVELLPGGEPVIFNERNETYTGWPPLDVQDHVIVFGTQKSNPVPWYRMTEAASVRGDAVRGSSSPLATALDKYLSPGSRGIGRRQTEIEDTTWTMSAVSLRVRANQTFRQREGEELDIREYTLRNFDIRPYLPDDPDTALHRVLMQAEWLAGASRREGFPYKQHKWIQGSDPADLAYGIDCSRAIWYAFTRAGLTYNRENEYLATAQMVGDESWMRDQFDECPADGELQIGDILVYRSDEKNDGHVVMVIDPTKKVAWGSHGWDGNAKESDYVIPPDTGVEFQRIKYKQDWERWDRGDMERKRCWRYRRFEEEAKTGAGLPGIKALGRVCSPSRCQY